MSFHHVCDRANALGLQGSCEEEEVVIRLHERLLTLLRPHDNAYITNQCLPPLDFGRAYEIRLLTSLYCVSGLRALSCSHQYSHSGGSFFSYRLVDSGNRRQA